MDFIFGVMISTHKRLLSTDCLNNSLEFCVVYNYDGLFTSKAVLQFAHLTKIFQIRQNGKM